MSVVTKIKTGSKFEEKNSFSRAVRVGDWIYSSNSSGRNYLTHEMSPDVSEQFDEAVKNIERAFSAVGASADDAIRVQISFCDLKDEGRVLEAFARRFKNIDPALTLICQPFSGNEVKVEVEIVAYIRSSSSENETLKI